uniref:Uncharacterized protein n=1 Tax=Cucumis melo TaxID=3656 RepID=A0A9I9EJU1_CUCME
MTRGEIVAEGRWSSNDPTTLVHHVSIGPHAIRVWVDIANIKNDMYLRSFGLSQLH